MRYDLWIPAAFSFLATYEPWLLRNGTTKKFSIFGIWQAEGGKERLREGERERERVR